MKILVEKYENAYGWHSDEVMMIKYYVIKEDASGDIVCIYNYASTDEIRDESRIKIKSWLKPMGKAYKSVKQRGNMKFEAYSAADFFTSFIHQEYVSRIEKSVFFTEKTNEELFLHVPEEYVPNEPVIEEHVDAELSKSFLEKIKKDENSYTHPLNSFIVYGDIQPAVGDFKDETGLVGSMVICPKCGKKDIILKNTLDFSYCYTKCSCSDVGNYRYPPMLYDSDYKEYRKENFADEDGIGLARSLMAKKTEGYYYVEAKDDGIIISKVIYTVSCKKGVIKKEINIEGQIRNLVKEGFSCIKIGKKGNKPLDPFKLLNINSKNIGTIPNLIYDGASDFFEFACNNQKALKMTGFTDCLKYVSGKVVLESMFIFFMGIVSKYPVMEQIIKMGHSNLFFKLYQNALSAENRWIIEKTIKDISEIVNTNTTKGKNSMRFPSYIGDFLLKKGAEMPEYIYWRNIYEVKKISKEQFDEIINSFEFAYINSQCGFADICNILKYGYEPLKLMKYLTKQGGDIKNTVYYLQDYLMMCEYIGVTPDLFPMDLKKQHDDIVSVYRSEQDKIDIERMVKLAEACDKQVNGIKGKTNEDEAVGIPKIFFDYEIVFPKYQSDFIEEGNMQHNCVGSYYQSVQGGMCIIFFIRKKESPEQSFITAEYKIDGHLGQFYYSNNRFVEDSDLVSLGEYVCRRLRQGMSTGSIKPIDKQS